MKAKKYGKTLLVVLLLSLSTCQNPSSPEYPPEDQERLRDIL
jgi:hypothetical protein